LKTDLGDKYRFNIAFKVRPADGENDLIPIDLISIFVGQTIDGKSGIQTSPITFPSIHGHWNAGDQIRFAVDVPKKFADTSQGWHLGFCVGTVHICQPSPNLMIGNVLNEVPDAIAQAEQGQAKAERERDRQQQLQEQAQREYEQQQEQQREQMRQQQQQEQQLMQRQQQQQQQVQ
jgi:hypothetical protein